ncbi:hypothetical protein AUR64_14830 [Haloprofundus marisrubri]|uniref:Uncharacterized protein n=1 Tax=Haloprofundus marisrubri TaxID=1514971 RepID=A0A0W1R784_9EURY|nr:hypothetical protein [Haloprofundus marisrubri]KTG09072.1 hypothetical protein AUR64_14830 [Haloprofundus marisrubri]
MIDSTFLVLVGLTVLAFEFDTALYVIWCRLVGIEPTLIVGYANLSRSWRVVVVTSIGASFGVFSSVVTDLYVGAAGVVFGAATLFAGVMLYELALHIASEAGIALSVTGSRSES